jgi:XisI protein
MDKVKKYQNIVIEFLNRYNTDTTISSDTVQQRVLIDKKNNSFQLLSVGWRNQLYTFGPIFHFDIINGKIWMQCNNTEREVVDELMEAGVRKSDIVLGFVQH